MENTNVDRSVGVIHLTVMGCAVVTKGALGRDLAAGVLAQDCCALWDGVQHVVLVHCCLGFNHAPCSSSTPSAIELATACYVHPARAT